MYAEVKKKEEPNVQYIQVTSAHRNRARFPHPAEFEVQLSNTLSRSANVPNYALDPIFNSVTKFPPPNLESPITYPTFSQMYGPLINGGNVPNDTIIGVLPTITNTNNQLKPIRPDIFENAYIDDTLELIEHTVGGVVTASNEYRKIVDYRISDTDAYVSTTIDAVQPILTTSVPLVSTLACDIDNFFTGWTITFTDVTDADLKDITRTIEYYRGYDKRVFFDRPIDFTITAGDEVILSVPTYEIRVDTPFSIGALPVLDDNCSFDDNTTFRIRNGTAPPINEGTLVAGTATTFTLPVSAGILDYTGYTIWLTSDPVVISGALTSATFVSDGTNQIQGTFVLPAASSIYPDDFLNNMTITLTSGSFSGQSYIITDWDNGTLTGTVTPGWTSVIVGTTAPSAADTFTVTQPNPSQYRVINSYNTTTRVGTVIPAFSYTNVSGTVTRYAVGSADAYEILQFIEDNHHSLNRPDSIVAQQQNHCYEISLISLTLPNIPLKSGIGGRITFYPFVYVEFSSLTRGSSAYNINSNSPNVTKNMMFTAPMLYNYQPELAAFITLDGHDMEQIQKAQTIDAFKFSVRLPNGELFITDEDYMSPSEPNPFLQISANFRFRRL